MISRISSAFWLVLLLGLPSQGWGAIAIDNSASVGNGSSTITETGYVTTGSDIYLICGVLQDSSAAPSGSYNGGALTFGSGTQATQAGGSYYVFLGVRAVGAGATGTISLTAGAGASDIWGDCASYSGVGVASGENGGDVSGAATYNMTVTVGADNSWLVGFAYDSDGTASTASTGTLRRQLNEVAGITAVFDSNGARSTGSQSLVVTHTTGPSTYRVLALEPASGGSAASPRGMLLGVLP